MQIQQFNSAVLFRTIKGFCCGSVVWSLLKVPNKCPPEQVCSVLVPILMDNMNDINNLGITVTTNAFVY